MIARYSIGVMILDDEHVKQRFQALKRWRLELSREKNVPAFVILSDRTLKEISGNTYRHASALSSAWGMGPVKMQLYSEAIFDVLQEIDEPFNLHSGCNCTIFNDNEFNNWVDENEVIYIDDYHPRRHGTNPKFNDVSRRVLNCKDMRPRAIAYYFEEINDMIDPTISCVVCVMPSSQKGVELSGIRLIANKLCERNNLINGTGVLYRNQTIPKKHLGGPRNPEREYESISLHEANLIANRQVLLLDDVATTEMSLKVGKKILLEGNATVVAMVALAKTSED